MKTNLLQDDQRQIYHRTARDNYTTGQLEKYATGQPETTVPQNSQKQISHGTVNGEYTIPQMLGDNYTVLGKMHHRTFVYKQGLEAWILRIHKALLHCWMSTG